MYLFLLDRLGAASAGPATLDALDKITLRASLAALASFVVALALGPRLIAWLQCRFREPIKSASADVTRLHRSKEATPTMGGIFIVGGLATSALALGDWTNRYLLLAIGLALALAVLGACDDLVKLRTSARGISAHIKLIVQTAIALAAAVGVYHLHAAGGHAFELTLPLVDGRFELGAWFVPLGVLVIVGSSNAVNLADGLDGLAGGCLISATAAVGVAVYACGHAEWAAYLGIEHHSGASELIVVSAAAMGGLLGFLWFNCHPASVFMGDTGSLPLGGLLGLLAVIARQELLLLVIGGVFVVEAASVIAQVGWFRCTRRRIFLCAPLHHHLQLRGWPEGKIVVRFWIAGALCAILGLAGLKLHTPERASGVRLAGKQQETAIRHQARSVSERMSVFPR